QLVPATLGDAGRQVQRRYRQAAHSGADAGGIVREADEVEVARQVPAQHGVEPVDVFGAVFRAPLHADDVARRSRSRGHQSPWRFFTDFCLGLARLIWPPAVRRWLPSTRSCLTSGRWPGRPNFSTLTSRGLSLRSSSTAFSFGGMRRHSTSSLPMCCT